LVLFQAISWENAGKVIATIFIVLKRRGFFPPFFVIFFMPVSVVLKMLWGALEEKDHNCNRRKRSQSACKSRHCARQDSPSFSSHRGGKNIRHQTVDAHSIQAIIAHHQQFI